MSGFPIVDLVIGIIFVYFLLSIICSAAIEIILTGLKARANLLEEWLLKLFNKTALKDGDKEISLGQAIMDHCTITGLSKKGKSSSYISAKEFTAALLEKITYDAAAPTNVARNIDEYIDAINKTKLLPTEFQRGLLNYANEVKAAYSDVAEQTESKLELFNSKIEDWYNSSMDRVTGELKRRYSRPVTFIIAVVVTVSLNADSIALAKYLYSNPEARTKFAMEAFSSTKDSALIKQVAALRLAPDSSNSSFDSAEIKKRITEKIEDLEKAKQGLADVMPLTWKQGELMKDGHYSWWLIFAKITGLLATILAIMMGAPFWFDQLNKISNLRGTGAKPAVATTDSGKK